MLKFLDDCQFFFKFCGYYAYDPTENLPHYRWSGIMNRTLTFTGIHLIVTSLAFIFDYRQPFDERMYAIMSVIAYTQLTIAHITLTTQKSKIREFFKYYETVINQSKFHSLRIFYLLFYFLNFLGQNLKDQLAHHGRLSICIWKLNEK